MSGVATVTAKGVSIDPGLRVMARGGSRGHAPHTAGPVITPQRRNADTFKNK